MLKLQTKGTAGVILFIVLVLIVPSILTFFIGAMIAKPFGFISFRWWAFVSLFYLIISLIVALISV